MLRIQSHLFLISLIIFGEDYFILWLLCNFLHHSVTFLLVSVILFDTLFKNAHSLCSSHSIRDPVLKPLKFLFCVLQNYSTPQKRGLGFFSALMCYYWLSCAIASEVGYTCSRNIWLPQVDHEQVAVTFSILCLCVHVFEVQLPFSTSFPISFFFQGKQSEKNSKR